MSDAQPRTVFIEAPPTKVAYAALRLVGDNSIRLPYGVFDDPQEAVERCHEDALARTHNRFGNAFDQYGRSYRVDTRSNEIGDWPAGSGYAVEQVLVEEEAE